MAGPWVGFARHVRIKRLTLSFAAFFVFVAFMISHHCVTAQGRCQGCLPRIDDVNDAMRPKKIAVLGAPIEIGASQRGTLMGPAALRTAGLMTLLDGLGFAVEDYGDLSVAGVAALDDKEPDNAKHYREIQPWIHTISAQAYGLARTGAIPIFLGGDHSLSMGSVNGVARHCREIGRELFVMWLDAHADYNTPATTITGNMHGMSAAFLCGEEGLDGLLGSEPRASIDSSCLELFGTRSVDKAERICCAFAASASPTCARSTNSASAF